VEQASRRGLGTASELPVIDLSAFEVMGRRRAARLLRTAAGDGFFYVRNSGIAPGRIARVFAHSRAFFALPPAQKDALLWDRTNRGYDGIEAQSFEPGQPGDLKESFRFTAEPDPGNAMVPEPRWGFLYNQPNKWPGGLPGFREELLGFLSDCGDVVERILAALEEALGMHQPLLRRHHERRNYTMRLLRYPGITGSVKNGQARCGEHTDWGTVTLLFQGGEHGLEVRRKSGEWISAVPIPETVLVNIGDQLETWTRGAFVSAPHRVRTESPHSRKDRYSIALFCYADYDAPIEIGEARTSGDYVLSKLARTQSTGTVAAA
jgi:isopenicillin N synthase-like dioxygenase